MVAGDKPQRLREDSEARLAVGPLSQELVAEALLALSAVHLECSRPANLGSLGDTVLVYRLGECRPGGVVRELGSAREQFIATLGADVSA